MEIFLLSILTFLFLFSPLILLYFYFLFYIWLTANTLPQYGPSYFSYSSKIYMASSFFISFSHKIIMFQLLFKLHMYHPVILYHNIINVDMNTWYFIVPPYLVFHWLSFKWLWLHQYFHFAVVTLIVVLICLLFFNWWVLFWTLL
jgi:hypothetical protein